MNQRSAWRPLGVVGFAIALAAALVLLPDTASACSCGPTPPLREWVGSSDVSLVGTPIAVERDAITINDGDEHPAHGEMELYRIEVEAVVAGDHLVPPGAVFTTLDVASNSDGSCGPSDLALSARLGLVTYRIGDVLVLHTCGGSVDPDELLDIDPDLPLPPSQGPAVMVTGPWSEASSNLQLRDARGEVVAWGALPSDLGAVSLCPGGRTIVSATMDWTRPDRTVQVIDLATMQPTQRAHFDDVSTRGDLVCLDEDGRRVAFLAGADERGNYLAIGDTTTSDVVSNNDRPGEVGHRAVTSRGDLLVVRRGGAYRLDSATAELVEIAELSDDLEPRRVDALDDGVIALLGPVDGTSADQVARIFADGQLEVLSIAPIEHPRRVVQLPDDSLLVVAANYDVHHLSNQGRALATLTTDPPGLAPPGDRGPQDPGIWIGVSEGGQLDWVEPGNTDVAMMVPHATAWHGVAALIEPLAVVPAARAVHRHTELRALYATAHGEQATRMKEDDPPLLPVDLGATLLIVALAAGFLLTRHRRSTLERMGNS